MFNNQTVSVMHKKQDDCAKTAEKPAIITAEGLINELISQEHPQNLQKNLRRMMDGFFMYHEQITPEFKDQVFGAYLQLTDFLEKLEQVEVCRYTHGRAVR